MNSSASSMTRDERRIAQARKNKAHQDEHARKRKEWLASHPEFVAQAEREKEERRKNNEALRMLASMKEPVPKNKKSTNIFAALMEDDGYTTEEYITDDELESEPAHAAPAATADKPIVFNAGKKFDWSEE